MGFVPILIPMRRHTRDFDLDSLKSSLPKAVSSVEWANSEEKRKVLTFVRRRRNPRCHLSTNGEGFAVISTSSGTARSTLNHWIAVIFASLYPDLKPPGLFSLSKLRGMGGPVGGGSTGRYSTGGGRIVGGPTVGRSAVGGPTCGAPAVVV
ncbi:unnamed protein product [Lactuca virosa]|uniref:Uncharacterized protein n=1 Tax=Lactuca virosa TaxID=75947 RepID=A0AAU9NVU4_9ASTR|nr:unnamed protein product [Lactuca virosa]